MADAGSQGASTPPGSTDHGSSPDTKGDDACASVPTIGTPPTCAACGQPMVQGVGCTADQIGRRSRVPYGSELRCRALCGVWWPGTSRLVALLRGTSRL